MSVTDYHHAHQFLRRIWLAHPRIYAELSPNEQWDLHAYFVPSKDWSKERLLRHRRAISAECPNLPGRASQLYDTFQTRAASWALQAVRARKQPPVKLPAGTRHHHLDITVRAIAKPEPDAAKLARGLVTWLSSLTPAQRDNLVATVTCQKRQRQSPDSDQPKAA